MIYLDSAATSFYRPPCVAEAVAEAISSMGNCSRGAYKEALTGARVILRPGSFYQKCSMEMVRSRWHLQPILPKA